MNRIKLAVTLLALALGAQGWADETSERAMEWNASVTKVGTKLSSTNDWNGAVADALIAAILAKPVDSLADCELSFLHASVNHQLVSKDKIAARKPIAAYLQASAIPKRALGGRTMELVLYADEAKAQQLMAQCAGYPVAAGAAWEAARRLGHVGSDAQSAYCESLFATLIGKGCDFPPYRLWFVTQVKAMTPPQARRAIRAEQDAIMNDAGAPMTESRRAWIDELELRIKVAKSKALDTP